MAKFSVLLPIYFRDSPEHLAECLSSLAAQTRPAEEILIVKDGSLGEALEGVIHSYSPRLPINILQLAENAGLGLALRAGVEKCCFEIIARMDADDVCALDRFELEVAFLEAHPEIDVLSGTMREFDSDPAVWITERRLPREHTAILAFAKHRNPINHMAVVFRKSAVIAAGSYRSLPGFEDYALWVRMLMNGSRFHNLDNVCTYARCGNGMHRRRGGWNYLLYEASLFWHFRSLGFLSTREAMRSIGLRLPVRLVPARLRSLLYRLFVRRSAVPPLDGYRDAPQRTAR
jgi:glycosyltransferase involved in cell wall biosynthesis